MATVTLILPLEAMAVNNSSDIRRNSRGDSRGDSEATAGVTEAAADQQRSNRELITER